MPKKYEQEIDEILRRFDDWPPRRRQRWRGSSLRAWTAWLRSAAAYLEVTPTRLLVASMILVLVGYLLRLVAPGLAGPVSLLGLAAFIAALVGSVIQRRRRWRQPAGWRGRSLQVATPTWWDALRWRWRLWRRRWRR